MGSGPSVRATRAYLPRKAYLVSSSTSRADTPLFAYVAAGAPKGLCLALAVRPDPAALPPTACCSTCSGRAGAHRAVPGRRPRPVRGPLSGLSSILTEQRKSKGRRPDLRHSYQNRGEVLATQRSAGGRVRDACCACGRGTRAACSRGVGAGGFLFWAMVAAQDAKSP